jgi:hypothetical protein
MYLYIVTGAEFRMILTHLLFVNSFNDCAHNVFYRLR